MLGFTIASYSEVTIIHIVRVGHKYIIILSFYHQNVCRRLGGNEGVDDGHRVGQEAYVQVQHEDVHTCVVESVKTKRKMMSVGA